MCCFYNTEKSRYAAVQLFLKKITNKFKWHKKLWIWASSRVTFTDDQEWHSEHHEQVEEVQCFWHRWNSQCFSQDNEEIIHRNDCSSHTDMLTADLLLQALSLSQNNSFSQNRKKLLHQFTFLKTDSLAQHCQKNYKNSYCWTNLKNDWET